jgi:hypothetical protein
VKRPAWEVKGVRTVARPTSPKVLVLESNIQDQAIIEIQIEALRERDIEKAIRCARVIREGLRYEARLVETFPAEGRRPRRAA